MNRNLARILWILSTTAICAFGSSPESWSVAVNGIYSIPASDLKNWFKPAPNLNFSIGKEKENGWTVEGQVELSRFERENLSGYPKGKLDLSLEHIGFLLNGRYPVAKLSIFKPYVTIAAGPHYWKGIRGEVALDSVNAVPYIAERRLEEWNWAFKAGAGVEISLGKVGLDFGANYRLIVGSLWPTLQEHIELDGVSGFQTWNLAIGVRWYF
ncbi:MAG: hypothetical protein PHW79_07790 [Candidatus Marinimicrobia bacterium]|nr:hypothetical protein [Candidatus Neomarinimicrobiota bacterium]